MKLLLSVAAVLAGATMFAAAAVAPLPAAHADPTDTQFVQDIRNGMGVEVPDEAGLIDSAHQVCASMKGGQPYDKVLTAFRQGNPYWDRDEAVYFIGAAVQAYCPEFAAG